MMHVLILMGGDSAERDVSFASGLAVARALAGRGHVVSGMDPASGQRYEGNNWYVKDRAIDRTPPPRSGAADRREQLARVLVDPSLARYDVVFLALHGGAGEDGTVQTLLGLAGALYTGSGPLSSAVAMHKDTSKRLFRQAGIPTPDWIFPVQAQTEAVEALGLPLIVKPVAEGSTVGVTLVKDKNELGPALERAGAEPMIEKFIPGRELSVGILGGRALPPVEIVPQHEIYDYECKYTDGKSEYICPAPIDQAATARVCDLAAKAFDALGCTGHARVDFRLAADGRPYCLEVNTLPGMTSHSLVPMEARTVGMEFPDLCEEICRLALEHRQRIATRA